MLQIKDIVYRIAGRPLIEGGSVAVAAGERIALVGRNGSGKTTLLKLIAGEIQADGGTITLRRALRVGALAQDIIGIGADGIGFKVTACFVGGSRAGLVMVVVDVEVGRGVVPDRAKLVA